MVYKNKYLNNKYGAISSTSYSKKIVRINRAVEKSNIKEPNYKLRKQLIAISVFLVALLFLFWQPLCDVSSIIFSSAPQEIKDISSSSGMSMRGQAVFLNNNPEFVSADNLVTVCPHNKDEIMYGCYLPGSNKIYILRVVNSELQPIETVAVVHETLHAIWYDMTYEQQRSIGQELEEFYNFNTSHILTADAEVYTKESPDILINELHSLSGAEVDYLNMPADLQEYYKKYFSNHSITVEANLDFNQSVDNQIAYINNKEKQLDYDKVRLDNYKIEHLDNIEAAMQQNMYYGDIYTYNKNVDAYNNNREIYNNMVDEYNKNVGEYNAKRQIFISAYSALFPNKKIPVAGAK